METPDIELPSESDARDGVNSDVVVTLCGNKISVPSVKNWPTAAIRALNQGDCELFAELVFDDENYEIWCSSNPTLSDAEAFFAEWTQASGTDPKSLNRAQRRSRSSRSR